MREKEEKAEEGEGEKERDIYNFIQYNLILGIISFNEIHNINAHHKYSHVIKGILN